MVPETSRMERDEQQEWHNLLHYNQPPLEQDPKSDAWQMERDEQQEWHNLLHYNQPPLEQDPKSDAWQMERDEQQEWHNLVHYNQPPLEQDPKSDAWQNGEGGCLLLYLCYVFCDFIVLRLTISLFCANVDLFTFIHVPDPNKVRVVERERNDDEPRLLETTVGRTVPLLPVAPDRADSELEASVDRLFDEGDSGRARGFRKGEDHGTPSGTSVGGKSRFSLQRLLVGVVLNAEVGVTAIPTLPFVTASVSTTSERDDEAHTDYVVEPSLHTIGAPQRFVISSDSSYHSGTHVAKAEVDSFVRSSIPVMTTVTTVTSAVDLTAPAKEKPVEPSLFGAGSSPAGGADPTPWKKKLRIWQLLLKETKATEAIRLRAESSKFEAVVKSLQKEMKALNERNTTLEKEKDDFDMKVTDLVALVAVREREVADSDALVTSVKSQNDNLVDRVRELEVFSFVLQDKVTIYEDCVGQLEKFQDDRMKEVNDKFDRLYADFIEMALHLEEKLCPRLLTTISSH
nr:hypothetical protein [Tanacetum cinerariifolium]